MFDDIRYGIPTSVERLCLILAAFSLGSDFSVPLLGLFLGVICSKVGDQKQMRLEKLFRSLQSPSLFFSPVVHELRSLTTDPQCIPFLFFPTNLGGNLLLKGIFHFGLGIKGRDTNSRRACRIISQVSSRIVSIIQLPDRKSVV